ncbi:sortase [Bacillus niameyensis]|uniref:sortase n=1 Tax=Bacillus niameyensis TaxID=1522308 RepID=UPI0007857780
MLNFYIGIGEVEGFTIPVGGKHLYSVFYIHIMREILTYRIESQKVIYPRETESLEVKEGKDLATLLTGHLYRHNYQRLLIRGEQEK